MTRPFDAIPSAIARTRALLFEPFDPNAWLALAFGVWLSGAGRANLSRWNSDVVEFPSWAFPSGPGAPPSLPDLEPWAVAAVAVVASFTVGLVVSVWALVLFLRCRGTFLALDAVVRRRVAIREAWTEHAEPANSLFRVRLALSLAVGAATAAVVGGAIAAVWQGWTGSPTAAQIAVAVAAVAAVGALALGAGLVDALLTEFVAPLQLATRASATEGFAALGRYLAVEPGGFLLYLVVRIFASACIGAAAMALTITTCGIGSLPFVGTVLLLPLLVFVRALSVAFVAQLGDDLALALGEPAPAP